VCCKVLQSIAVFSSVLRFHVRWLLFTCSAAACCSVLQCVASTTCCSVLQHGNTLQHTATRCTATRCYLFCGRRILLCVMQCATTCCSVLQCVASFFEYLAAWRSHCSSNHLRQGVNTGDRAIGSDIQESQHAARLRWEAVQRLSGILHEVHDAEVDIYIYIYNRHLYKYEYGYMDKDTYIHTDVCTCVCMCLCMYTHNMVTLRSCAVFAGYSVRSA